jgi:uncharacterized membrane protein YbhN (UPF0104 family)
VKKRGAIWNVGWRLVVGGLLLLWIFHSIFIIEGRRALPAGGPVWEQLSRRDQWQLAWSSGPRELWDTLRLVKSSAFALSLVFMGATILLGVLRWRLVLRVQGLDLSLGRTAEISLVAHFFNSFLLGSTGGDLLKAYYAARETHHKKTEAVVTVFVDRLIGLFAMLFFACLMMLPNFSLLTTHRPLAALAWFIVLMMAGCGGVVALSFWGGVSRRWPQARLWLRKLPKGELLERALEASRRFGKQPLLLFQMLAISMALNIFCVLQIMALARGLGLSISPLALFVIVPVVVCISALPISPSGLGVRENLYVLMLGVKEINVDATAALSLSLLAYAGSLLWSILGGIVYMTRRERDHLAEITAPESATEDV